ncbi:hypothetical protein F3Y22_tig00110769pilonHSYRG00007 [Hibiscus syriacus]|uniref:Uncharacterized protein n=1 Tax=Hibiscus syriacus TaxID=106335 RepID=A0A6A2ZUL6_HIBSY|nr:hypothetical protein F3Y22_tig00110769pilonHSYRG00007 [Hibiscus syriacus]
MSKMDKIAVAFNEAALLHETSGSEHSPEDPTDLSDLVNSFFESGGGFDVETDEAVTFHQERDVSDDYCRIPKRKVWYGLSEDFKRRLMSHLRDKGFDAGLCKTRWDKLGRNLLSVAYEYASLLELIPPIFVGKPKELKQIVKLMRKAIHENREHVLATVAAKWLHAIQVVRSSQSHR